MNDRFTYAVKAFWEKIPPDIQERLLNNVWCSHCASITAITDYSGTT
ncbi:hypothetical protein KKC74_01355 [bacterium]|nr:hypothetical protein [bacterium]